MARLDTEKMINDLEALEQKSDTAFDRYITTRDTRPKEEATRAWEAYERANKRMIRALDIIAQSPAKVRAYEMHYGVEFER